MKLKGRVKQGLAHLLIVSGCLLSTAWIDPFHDEVEKGNREFADKKYNAAKTFYRRAEKYAPGEEHKKKLMFNIGDADYMAELHDEAIAGFEQALKSDDKEVQKKAFFNIGNAYVKQGKYREAVQSYINALKIDPGYERAKKNIEYLLAKQKQDREKQKQGGGQGKDGKDKQQGKDKDRNKQSQRQKDRDRQGQGSGLNRAQIKNLLDTMKQNPVRRYKGKGNDSRQLDKPW
ncbi:MAG: tetratricopeptide repeat protein [Spirochaetes bacterium]|nr:tetratricopeptide repeat protein [Spirochaetota bacterium]